MNYQKTTLALLIALVVTFPTVAPAQTTSTAASSTDTQVSQLITQINALKSQLATLLGGKQGQPNHNDDLGKLFYGLFGGVASGTPPQLSGDHGEFVPPRLCNTLKRTLTSGVKGDDVSAVQEFLGEQGFLEASSTGTFGPKTRDALVRFQLKAGLASSTVDAGLGIFGPRTRALIKDKFCGQPGMSEGRPPMPPFGAGSTTPPWMNGSSTPPTACAGVFQPVCGRPSGCANTCEPGKMCPMYCLQQPSHTYPNKCILDATGGTYISDGECPRLDHATGTPGILPERLPMSPTSTHFIIPHYGE
jgi:hypothetical protein